MLAVVAFQAAFAASVGGQTGVTVDVAVVYTSAARADAGGAAEIATEIDLMVAETNRIYEVSGVRHRVALTGRSEVRYVGTGDARRDLERLADPSDGHMDEAHALRDRVGADLVHLIIGREPVNVGGIAYIGGVFGLSAYTSGWLFAHELGHNMGLWHDRYQVHHHEGGALDSTHPAAFGYVNQRAFAAGAPASSRWATVMATNTQCVDAGFRCRELSRFSNPRQLYEGDPLGVDVSGGRASEVTGPADAVAVLNDQMPVVAGWRDRVAGPNRSPVAAGALADVTLTAGGTSEVDVSRAFIDPDGDPLTWGVSSSALGVVTVTAAGPRVTVTAVSPGAAIVRVTATDPGGLSASQSFAVTVGDPNRPPSAVGALPDLTLTAGGMSEVDVSRAFTDPDGDPLTWGVSSSAPGVVTVTAVGARLTLTAVRPGGATVRVTATDPGGLSASQSFAVTVRRPFTDDPIRPGATPIRAVHFTELRTRIDGLRQAAGLAAFAWTDPVLRAGVTRVRLVHLLELRQALGAAYRAAGRTPPRWTDAVPAAGTTAIRAAHLMELRTAVSALE